MAKVKFNVKGVDAKSDRKVPKPGVYVCKVTQCVDAQPSGKDRRLEVVYEITEKGEFKGAKLFDYINLESEAASWKLRQFLEAVGIVQGKKESGQFDPDEIVGTALSIRVRVTNDEQYGMQAKPATLLPLDDDADEEDEEDLEDEELEDEDEDDSDDDDESDEDEDDDEDSDDEDDEDEDEDEDEEQDYSAMTADELIEEAEERDLDIADILGKGKAKLKGVKAKKALIAALEESDEEDEDEEDDEEDVDYESMTLKELKALCEERELSPKGSKEALIKRLEKDDKPF